MTIIKSKSDKKAMVSDGLQGGGSMSQSSYSLGSTKGVRGVGAALVAAQRCEREGKPREGVRGSSSSCSGAARGHQAPEATKQT